MNLWIDRFFFFWLKGYESLANDPEVEVVYIGAIHPAHLEICRMMFNAGKHILCEKVRFQGSFFFYIFQEFLVKN